MVCRDQARVVRNRLRHWLQSRTTAGHGLSFRHRTETESMPIPAHRPELDRPAKCCWAESGLREDVTVSMAAPRWGCWGTRVGRFLAVLTLLMVGLSAPQVTLAEDAREFVPLPEPMQAHMLANMRDHLASLSEILAHMADGELDAAAAIAETRLGMSALEAHGASHMARFMPAGMQRAGTAMHHAASRFSLRAQEGEPAAAYRALAELSATCVSCHAGYRIR